MLMNAPRISESRKNTSTHDTTAESMDIRRLLIGFTALFLTFSGASAAEAVRITNGEWPPFTSPQLPHGGPFSRIVLEAFELEGVRIEFGFFPWKRAYEYARSGTWDGSVGWAKAPRHMDDFFMSIPIISVDKVLIHLKSTHFDWESIADLKRWRVGAVAGYSYGDDWDSAVENGALQVETTTLDEQNIKKLLQKRVDVVAIERDVARHLIQTRFPPHVADEIAYHPRMLQRTPISLALSRQLPNAPELLERFHRGLERLKKSGNFDAYLTEYSIANEAGAVQTGSVKKP